MIKLKIPLFLLLGLFLLSGTINSSKAQMVDPVTWSYSVKSINDSIYELHFTAAIEPSWHMYNQFVQEDGPQPIVFTFQPSANFQRVDSVIEVTKAHKEFDAMFNLSVY